MQIRPPQQEVRVIYLYNMTKAERYEKRVTTVLTEQNFIVGITEKKLIQKRTASGRRYFFMVAKRREGTDIVERFVKIPENNTKKLLEPFRRQIEVGEYLKNNNIINTRGVIASNHDAKKGIPFVVMETFAAHHSKIGFIEGDAGVSKLTGKEASSAIDQLLKLHAVSVRSLPLSLRKSLKKYTGEYSKFKSEIARYLAKKVVPLDAVGQTPEPFHLVLERRLQMPAVKT